MKKMFSYLKPYWFLAIISPIMMMAEVAADLALPNFMKYIVNYGIEGISITDPEQGSSLAAGIMRFIFGENYNQVNIIVTFGITMLIITLLGGFFGMFCAYTAATAAHGLGYDLRRDAYGKVMSLSIEQTDKFTTGSLITRMTNDISIVVDFFEMIMRGFVRAPMFIIGGTFMIVMLNLKFTTVLLCAVPALLIVVVSVLIRVTPVYSRIQQRLDRVNSVVGENISGARVVKAFVREDYECDRFDGANKALYKENLSALTTMAIISPILTIIMNFSIMAVIYIGGFNISIENAGMSTGDIMAAITYITQVIFSVMMATNIFQSIIRASASAKRVNEVLSTNPVIMGGVKSAGADATAISFRNVNFRYPAAHGRPVLKNINLDVKRGETLAIIGSTGCGKSTLMRIMLGFEKPQKGAVYYDGKDLSGIDLKSLRRKIGVVMQNGKLFQGDIYSNIVISAPQLSMDEAWAAAEMSGIAEDIRRMPMGMHTMISEGSGGISGGQRQRIMIARAIAPKPKIIMLDEATSALDNTTEVLIQGALDELCRGRTTLVVAHRLSTIRGADEIAVVEGGRITERGTHEELIARGGVYKQLYALQFRED